MKESTVITIQLSDLGPAMWILGEPPTPKLTLNFADPGPYELDFLTDLTEQEQKYVINSVANRSLECSHEAERLLQWHLDVTRPVIHTIEAEMPPQQLAQIEEEEEEEEEEPKPVKTKKKPESLPHRWTFQKEQDKKRKQTQLLNHKAKREELGLPEKKKKKAAGSRAAQVISIANLLKLSTDVVLLELKKEKDPRRLKEIIRAEKENRKRTKILGYAAQKLHDIETAIADSISHSAKTEPIKWQPPRDKLSYEVEDSDVELVTLAHGEPLP